MEKINYDIEIKSKTYTKDSSNCKDPTCLSSSNDNHEKQSKTFDENYINTYSNKFRFANDDEIERVSEKPEDLIEIQIEILNPLVQENLNENVKNIIFLFLNPDSGSQEGRVILDIAKKNNLKKDDTIIKFKFLSKIATNYAFIFNIKCAENLKTGTLLLKEYVKIVKPNEKVKVLIGGGDGSVLSMIEDFKKHGITIENCCFGHVPLGTGNDLSNAVGFGNALNIKNDPECLIEILRKYYAAREGKIDIWNLKLVLDKDKGEVKKNTKDGKIPVQLQEGNVFRKTFINYFSIGYDARVGYNFDKNRSSSRCWNKLLYFWEGCKKNMCRKTVPINSFVDSFRVVEPRNKSIDDINLYAKKIQNLINEHPDLPVNKSHDSIINSKNEIKNVFRSKSIYLQKRQSHLDLAKYKEIVLKGNPVSLICQNINFYMGGTKDIWKKSGSKLGVEVLEDLKISTSETKILQKFLCESEQKFNDKKLEFFTYSSGLSIGCEKIMTGRADKVYHGPGPIIIDFKDTPEKSQTDRYNRIYLNLDGEYYFLGKPIELRVRLNEELCQGGLNFMIKRDD